MHGGLSHVSQDADADEDGLTPRRPMRVCGPGYSSFFDAMRLRISLAMSASISEG
jgi:hypothetical protein